MQRHLSKFPGRHERHFRRKLDNPLFPRPTTADVEALVETQRLDHEELLAFLTELREAVQAAVELQPNEESQVILDLKERLDKLYEAASGLAEDQTGNKDALRQLIAVIMATVRASAAGDSQAEDELQQEEIARATHFHLLEQPLVAELLHPQSAIQPDELAATLLSEDEAALKAALELFDEGQLMLLLGEARPLLESSDPDKTLLPAAWQNLALLEQRLQLHGERAEA